MFSRLTRTLAVPAALVALVATAGPAASNRTVYPTVTASLGLMGQPPSPHQGWYAGHNAPSFSSDELTSYCDTFVGYRYGTLTHPHGYEIEVVDTGEYTYTTYGEHAYVMYDPANNWLRPANVTMRSGGMYLTSPTRDDRCGGHPD